MLRSGSMPCGFSYLLQRSKLCHAANGPTSRYVDTWGTKTLLVAMLAFVTLSIFIPAYHVSTDIDSQLGWRQLGKRVVT